MQQFVNLSYDIVKSDMLVNAARYSGRIVFSGQGYELEFGYTIFKVEIFTSVSLLLSGI